jgi:hypothetical protein
MNKILKYCLIFGIPIIFIIMFFFIPVITIMVPDRLIYGDYFCYTSNGSCLSTAGHSTEIDLTIFQYLKVNNNLPIR